MKIIHKFVRLIRPPESTRIDLATRLPDKPLPTPIWQLAFRIIVLSLSGSSFSAGNSLPLLMIPYREPLSASLCYRHLAALFLLAVCCHFSCFHIASRFPYHYSIAAARPSANYSINHLPLVSRTANQSRVITIEKR